MINQVMLIQTTAKQESPMIVLPFILQETALYCSFSLPEPLAEALVKAASVEGVRLRFRREGGRAVMVIGFAGVDPENILPSVEALKKAWEPFQES